MERERPSFMFSDEYGPSELVNLTRDKEGPVSVIRMGVLTMTFKSLQVYVRLIRSLSSRLSMIMIKTSVGRVRAGAPPTSEPCISEIEI